MQSTPRNRALRSVALAALVALVLGVPGCVHEGVPASVEADAAETAAPTPKPTGPVGIAWEVPEGPVAGRSVATAVVITAYADLEDVRVAIGSAPEARPAGQGRLAVGSLAAGETRRVPVPLALGTSGRAEVRAEVVATAAGEPTGAADVVYALLAPDESVVTRGSFVVAEQARLARALETGRMSRAAYEEALRAIRSGEAEVVVRDSGQKKTGLGANEFTLSGTIRYQDSAGASHPVRFAPVEVWDEDIGPDDLILTTATDANGDFSVTVPNDPIENPDIYLQIFARSTGFYVVTPGNQGDIDETYLVDTTDNVFDDVTADLAIDVTILNSTTPGNAFSVQDALVESTRYMNDLTGAFLPTLSVEFAGSYATSFYQPGSGLFILLLDRYDWDVLHHEFGHYVMDQANIENNPGGSHGLGENLAERLGKDEGIRLAWGEGWPTFFGTSLQQERNNAAFGIPNVGDLGYQDTEDTSINYSLESQATAPSRGEDNEVAVSRALWDVYDGANDERDEIGIGDDAVWAALTGANATTLSAAWNALTSGLSVEDLTRYGAVFADHRVAPDPTAPADNEVIELTGGPPPTFTWTPNGAGPSHRLNRFTVVFYTEDFATLLFESPEQTTPSYTPAEGVLAQQVFRTTNRVKWFVRGRNVTAPATGTYVSPARTLESSGVDVAFVIDDTGSMGEEIAGVRQGLLNHLASYPDDGTTTFQLITFKDGVSVGAPTRDLSAIQSQVGGLVASGGGDCPEASAEAVVAAESQLKDGGRVFLATDADPHPGTDTPGTINALRARGIRVDVILSGSCEVTGDRVAGRQGNGNDATPDRAEGPAKPASARLAHRNAVVRLGPAADPLDLGDDDFAEVLLPFEFPFGAGRYSTAFVNSNGSVSFSRGDTGLTGSTGALLAGPPRIAPLWDDLHPGRSGVVSVEEVDGNAVITFDTVPEFAGGGFVSFTLTLRPDGTFAIAYGEVTASSVFTAVHTGGSDDPGPTDLSAAPQPIDADPAGTLYEAFGGMSDLGGTTLEFDDVESGPPPPPPILNAIEAFSLMAAGTGGIFAFQPEVNSGGPVGAQQFENTVFNLVQGGVNQALALTHPGQGPQGGRLDVALTGSGTTFRAGATRLEVDGAGVAVERVTVVSPIRLVATLAIAPDAATGFYDLLAITEQGAEADTARGVGSFRVTEPLPGPAVLSVSPSTVAAGESRTVTLFGAGTAFDATSEVQLSSGITITSTTVVSPTEIQAAIEVSPVAEIGRRNVQVVTGAEVAGQSRPGLLFVAADAPSEAALAAVAPDAGARGTEITLGVTGVNTGFEDGVSELSLSGEGIETLSTTVISATSLEAVVRIDAAAPPGARDVRVATGADVVVLLDGFVVSDFVLAAPALLGPDDGADGLTARPTLTWEAVAGALRYGVQVAADATFADPLLDEETTEPSQPTEGLPGNATYVWRVRALGDGAAQSPWSETRSFGLGAIVATADAPTVHAFLPGAPNPFAARTDLRYELPRAGHVTLTVYDARGARVAVLVDEDRPAGRHTLSWSPGGLAPGLYLCRLQADDFVGVQKVMLVR